MRRTGLLFGVLMALGYAVGASMGQAPPAPPKAPPAPDKGEKAAEKPAPPTAGELVPSLPGEKAPADGPRIQIDQPVHDFGDVWVKESLEHAFEVRNVGTQTLEITQVKPGCGCTISGKYDREIPPGGVGKVPLTLKTKNMTTFTKHIKILCNDPTNPEMQVTLKGRIRYHVDVNPMNVRFPRARVDEPLKQTVKIKVNTEGAKLELLNDGKSGKFKATLTQGARPDEYELLVEGLPPLNEGSNTGKFEVKTGVPEQPMLTIPVYAFVPQRIEIQPSQLVFREETTAPTTRRINVTNNGDTPVEVLSASVSNPEIKAEVNEAQKGKRYQITMQLPANYLPPLEGDKLTLKLLDGTERDQVVPILSRKYVRPALRLLGSAAPKATLNLNGGSTYETGGTGQVVVLNFYTSWCRYCARQMPTVEQAYESFKGNPDVRFIAVSEDRREGKQARTPEQVVGTFKERGLTYELAFDPDQAVGKVYFATSYPTLFVLGKTGEVEAVHVGAQANLSDQLVQEIKTLLEGKKLQEAKSSAEPKEVPSRPTPPHTGARKSG